MSDPPTPPVRRTAALGGDAAHHQAARFLLVGATTVAIDFVAYQLLLAVDVQVSLAKTVSFVVATVCAYLLNRSFTFRAGGGGHVVARFVALYTAALLVNVGVNAGVLGVLPDLLTVDGDSQVAIVLAFLVAQAVSSTLNFLGMRHWVFAGTQQGPAR